MRSARIRDTIAIIGLLLALAPSGGPYPDTGPLCAACGEPITGEVVTARSADYHPEHFVCALCRNPLTGQFVVHEGSNYHESCYTKRVAPRCGLCGHVISDRYIVDYWGTPYHASHEGSDPQCAYCSRFLSPKGTRGGSAYDDGRVVCGLCRRTAVHTEREAASLMSRAASTLSRYGIDVEPSPIRLHLVDLDALKRESGAGGHSLQGLTKTQRTSLAGIGIENTTDIYILRGMPREDALGTLAHELMHVWLAGHEGAHKSSAHVEGSCNFAAYLVLAEEDTPQSRFIIKAMMESEDRVYGKGFRRVKRFAEEKGIARWLSWLASGDLLPAGS